MRVDIEDFNRLAADLRAAGPKGRLAAARVTVALLVVPAPRCSANGATTTSPGVRLLTGVLKLSAPAEPGDACSLKEDWAESTAPSRLK